MFALLVVMFPLSVAQADRLTIPLGEQATSRGDSLPQRGMSAQRVIERHGEPSQRHEPVGEPPIQRWDYAGFSVYLEHDHVVHSVRQHQRHRPEAP
ncbi:phosphodiesterase [Halopseudomonas nanhaiensis]|uniref:phosphodiesterase n=1 Tax=Halopseudomonas nanhaiensis TaxID=2830842 RepID=UPI001CBF2FF6|nr:phosphodiesterase [Halopseudomonas nanhaiensis]